MSDIRELHKQLLGGRVERGYSSEKHRYIYTGFLPGGSSLSLSYRDFISLKSQNLLQAVDDLGLTWNVVSPPQED